MSFEELWCASPSKAQREIDETNREIRRREEAEENEVARAPASFLWGARRQFQ